MPVGALLNVGIENSANSPVGVRRPIRLLEYSVIHRLPSGPVTMEWGRLLVPIENSVIDPAGVILPALPPCPSPPCSSKNHRLPSGPSVMPVNTLSGVGTTYSAKTVPAGDILAI